MADPLDTGSTRKCLARRFVAVFAAATVASGLFWALVDFGRFAPASAGTLEERLYWFGMVECGPLAFARAASGPADDMFWFGGIVATLSLASVVAALLRPANSALKRLAYAALICWFFWGFCIAGLRVT